MICSRVRVWGRDNTVELQERYGFTSTPSLALICERQRKQPPSKRAEVVVNDAIKLKLDILKAAIE